MFNKLETDEAAVILLFNAQETWCKQSNLEKENKIEKKGERKKNDNNNNNKGFLVAQNETEISGCESPSKTELSFVRVAESGPTEGKSDLLHGGGLGLASVPIRVTSGFFYFRKCPRIT